MDTLEENLEKQIKDINDIVEKYWNEYNGCEPAKPSRDIIDKIESLVSEYGYHKVADGFNISTKQYCLTFDEYTTDAESFELNEDVLGNADDGFYTYKAYCRWRSYWPILISSNSMNMIKEYESRVRKCHGEFFTLTKHVLRLPVAVFNRLGEWERDNFDWHDDDCQYMIDTFEYTMTDAELEQCHAKYQSSRIKEIVLELIKNSAELPLDAIQAYSLCKTRSVTPEGWGADIYVLSESDRTEIKHTLSDIVGNEVVSNLFDKDRMYDSYYLRGTDKREDAFGICFNNGANRESLYRPKVDTDKYLLSVFPVKTR